MFFIPRLLQLLPSSFSSSPGFTSPGLALEFLPNVMLNSPVAGLVLKMTSLLKLILMWALIDNHCECRYEMQNLAKPNFWTWYLNSGLLLVLRLLGRLCHSQTLRASRGQPSEGFWRGLLHFQVLSSNKAACSKYRLCVKNFAIFHHKYT